MSELKLPTEVEIFRLAQGYAEVYAGGDGPRAWDQWHLIDRDDFWESAARNLGVPSGHALLTLPEAYAMPERPFTGGHPSIEDLVGAAIMKDLPTIAESLRALMPDRFAAPTQSAEPTKE